MAKLNTLYAHKSLGLWWVEEGDPAVGLHGPFMDLPDAREQTEYLGLPFVNLHESDAA